MLNAKRLLYILPDVAYIAELLPGKKDHTFAVQSFRQVNGEFMEDENIKAENSDKLFSKLDKEEFHVILPDFLFTNTIVEVEASSEAKAQAHIKDKLLPSLSISAETHLIKSFVLTSRKNMFSMQISAIEHETLQPIKAAADTAGVVISGISPLTWAIKAIISLEPSISVLQLGAHVYVAKHYIGVDQASFFAAAEVTDVVESIKSLKGAEPTIQTVYVMSNELVESQLKDGLKQTIPIQQLSPQADDKSDLPAHIKEILEQTMRTLDISDFPVPSFQLKDVTDVKDVTENATIAPVATEKTTKDEPTEFKEEPIEETPAVVAPILSEHIDLDEDAEDSEDTQEDGEDTKEKSDDILATEEVTTPLEVPSIDTAELPKPAAIATPIMPELTPDPINASEDIILPTPEATLTPSEPVLAPLPEVTPVDTKTAEETLTQQTLEKFAPHREDSESVVSSLSDSMQTTPNQTQSDVIKNPSATGTMVKMVFITISVLFLTVAVGVGLGLGFLTWQQKSNENTQLPIAVSPSPVAQIAPSPSPVATTSAQIDKKTVKLLVVNATSIAGKAGGIKKDLETAGFEGVSAGNAKGTYKESGVFVLMKVEDPALVAEIKSATKLDVTFAEGITTEDPKGTYTAVVVLNE